MKEQVSLTELSRYMTELATQLGETCRERHGNHVPLVYRMTEAQSMFERIALAEIESRKAVELARLEKGEAK